MNHIHRSIWNVCSCTFVAVAENTNSRGKPASAGPAARVRVGRQAGDGLGLSTAGPAPAWLTLSLMLAFAPTLQALPTGGQVAAGSATLVRAVATTTVTQTSPNLVINWQSFNLGATETVNFVQPTSQAIAVNRIADVNGSQIQGRINANGQVWLINPNGVLFGRDAQVNVGGLVASTLDSIDGALNGNSRRFAGDSRAGVLNLGQITAADGGSVALLGHQVSNQGSIKVRLGTVALGAGSAVTLSFDGSRLLNLRIDENLLGALTENGGLLRADGGQVLMSAGARNTVLASVVSNTGVVEARTVEQHEGRIVLLGGMAAGSTRVDGRLDASAHDGANGGFIETSAAKVSVADSARVTTAAPQGRAGTWLIDPTDFTVSASGGDMTGAAVASALAGGNFTVQSSNGASGSAGNVNINDTVAWGANQLTLNAEANISLNAALTGTGTASLSLQYGQGAVASGNAAKYSVNAPVTLPAGNNFSTKLGSDGSVIAYTVITRLGAAGSSTGADLQGLAGNLSGNYALGADIDASSTASWNSGAGFAPVGDSSTAFTGKLAGLGHMVSDLTIYRPSSDNVGLFGQLNYNAADSGVRDLTLAGGSVAGANKVGALVGESLTSTLSHITSSVTVSGVSSVGGVAGVLKNGSGVNNLTASGSVSATGDIVGGVIGDLQNNNGSIGLNLSASGAVSGANAVGGVAGRLHAGGNLDGASATGQVTGSGGYVGGLVGNLGQDSGASIIRSNASGAVSGAGDYVGGLIGRSSGGSSFSNSSASGAVSSTANYVGGLIGQQESGSNSGNSASGSVSGVDYVGGYAGASTNGMVVINGSASGAVSGRNRVGGLIGDAKNGSGASNSRASGKVTASGDDAGGLIGHGESGANANFSSASGDVSGANHVGGLIGYGLNGSGANYSHASGSVIASGDAAGGLIGYACNGSGAGISDASGAVSGASRVGGLIGDALNGSGANGSHASGNVTASGDFVGGLIGATYNGSSVNVSHAIGNVSGHGQVGGLIGNSGTNSPVTRSFATGAVSATDDYAGGLIGQSLSAVNASYATGAVSGQGYAGGLVGWASGAASTLTDAFAAGNVSGTARVGGLVGQSDLGALTRVYAAGAVAGSSDVGGLVGVLNGSTLTNGYWNITRSGQAAGVGTLLGEATDTSTGLSDAQAFTANSYSGFTFTNSAGDAGSSTANRWVMVNADGTLVGGGGSSSASATRPMLAGTWRSDIGDAVGLQLMALKLDGSYTLANNIDASATARAVADSGNGGVWGAAGFVPVGTGRIVGASDQYAAGTAFSGSLNGGYHRVSQLSILAGWDYVGLFGVLAGGGSVSAIALIDATVVRGVPAAPLNSNADYPLVGALVGLNQGAVSDALATGIVSSAGAGANIGGLVGWQTGNGSVTRSMAAVNVQATASANAGLWMGGLVGTQQSPNSSITDSYATGSVSSAVIGSDSAVGGLVGYNMGSVNRSYATGAISAGASGLAGHAALVGVNSGGTVFDSVASGLVLGVAGTGSGNRSAAAMKQAATFSGLDFSNTWVISEGHTTPLLRNWLTPLTVNIANGSGPLTKVYDASTAFSGPTVSGYSLASVDTSLVLGSPGMLGSKNAGVQTLSADLYSTQLGYLISTSTTGASTVTVTPATLAVTGVSATSRTYDATTVATLTGTAAVSPLGLVPDDVGVTTTSSATGLFADKNVGTAKSVTVAGFSLTGADAGNYNVAQPIGLSADITRATLAVNGVTAVGKTYDAARSASLTGIAAVSPLGLVPDDVGVTATASATGLFVDKNVGTAKAVTVTGFSLTGVDAGNYSVAQPTGVSADITRATLAVTGVSAVGKTYDTTRAASLTGTAAVAPLGIDPDAVGVTATASATGLFASKNVGIEKSVTVTGFSLTGADAGNYTVAQPTGLSADITRATLAVNGVTAVGKTYDATRSASLTGIAEVAPLGLAPDDVGVTATANAAGLFVDKNVGTAKSVTVTGFSLTGADAGNYTVVQPTGVIADVTAATLRYEATPLSVTGGQPLVGLAGTVTGLLGADSLVSATSGTAIWSTTALSSSVPGNYPLTGDGLSATNYRFVQAAANAAALTLKPGSLPQTVSGATSSLAVTVSANQAFNTATLPNLPPSSASALALDSSPTPLPGAIPSTGTESTAGTSGSTSGSTTTSAITAISAGSLSIGGGSGRVQLLNGGLRLPSALADGASN